MIRAPGFSNNESKDKVFQNNASIAIRESPICVEDMFVVLAVYDAKVPGVGRRGVTVEDEEKVFMPSMNV